MTLTGDITAKLIKIQKDKNQNSNYYNDNKFLIFALSLLSKKSTVISTFIEGLSFKVEEIHEYITVLKENQLLSADDIKALERIGKTKQKKSYNDEINEVITHLNTLTNRNLKLNTVREKRLKSLLSSNQYTVTDFKYVNLYFTKLWGNDSNMKKYLTPDTLYNGKFDSRLEQANEFFSIFKKHEKSIHIMCDKFHKLFEVEIYPKHKLLASEIQIDADICQEIPMQLQNTIVHWLELDYSVEEIMTTIELTVESWSKKSELKNHISISKILDSKFPERAVVASKILEKKTQPQLKESQAKVNSWLEKRKG